MLGSRSDLERAVDALLSATMEETQARTASYLHVAYPDMGNIALFGAGNMGRTTLARLRANGVEPKAFIDDTPSKQGTTIDGLPVISREEAKSTLAGDVTVVVTILNPKLIFNRANQLLQSSGFRSVSLMSLGWAFPDSFKNLVNTAPPDYMIDHRSAITKAMNIWSDEESAAVYLKQIYWRMTLDFDRLPHATLDDIYFPKDLDIDLGDTVSFVDAGAYDGDTVAGFIRHTNGSFASVVAIEPDVQNFKKLDDSLAALRADGRATTYNMGVGGSEGELRFRATGDMSAALDLEGDTVVMIKPLSFFYPNSGQVYAKFDIEGAEWDTLVASEELIATRQPKLAVSVYHHPSDLWRIPLLIQQYLPDARLHLRAHGVDGTDVVLYAV